MGVKYQLTNEQGREYSSVVERRNWDQKHETPHLLDEEALSLEDQ